MKKNVIKPTRFARYLFDNNLFLTDAMTDTGISYPTLIKVKKGRYKNCDPRTLATIALYCQCTVEELTEDYVEIKPKKESAFNQALANLSKKRGIHISLDDVHKATGVSKTIFTKLRKGDASGCEERTLNDVAAFLEITADELRKNKLIKRN